MSKAWPVMFRNELTLPTSFLSYYLRDILQMGQLASLDLSDLLNFIRKSFTVKERFKYDDQKEVEKTGHFPLV